MNDDTLIPVFMPPLVVLLAHAEQEKGAPLTQEEVLAIRGKGVCIMLKRSIAIEMAKKRGYDDIDPIHAWDDWQTARLTSPPNEKTD